MGFEAIAAADLTGMEERKRGDRLSVDTFSCRGLPTERDQALFEICLYTTARINENIRQPYLTDAMS